MTRPVRRQIPLPTKEQLREFIRESSGPVHKREIARAFNIRGDDRALLRQMLKDLESDGIVDRPHKRTFAPPGALPSVAVVEVTGTDLDGELLARPMVWRGTGHPPKIILAQERTRSGPAIGVGDRVLARLREVGNHIYEGRPIKRLAAAPAQILGVYEPVGEAGGRLRPTNRREKGEYRVGQGESLGAAERVPGGRHYGPRPVRVIERLGNMTNPRAISLIAIHSHDIPVEFPPEALAQAAAAGPASDTGREDLRPLPLVTIDGEDARDFDDAVWAEPDTDPANPGGWHVIVAIADVAWYVRPGDALDRAAFERGNSVYFPDRVVPMLPEVLSNGWGSLKPEEDRPCLAVHMWLDVQGNRQRHRFTRAVMRSAARLTYTRVQAARAGVPAEAMTFLAPTVIAPLYGAYKALQAWRERRGTLELDLPERRVVLGDAGKLGRVEPRPRYDSHRLIEEFMIAANVAAAEQIETVGQPCMYRLHDQPSPDKLDALRDFLATIGLKLSRGQVLKPQHFNQILAKAAGTPQAHIVNEIVLRSQAQAEYNPAHIGHFGLCLSHYAHFTSPIRRYADLLVHRALIAGLRLGEGAHSPDSLSQFADMGGHISATERRAAAAEREAVNRYATAFLAAHVGATFSGRVNGVTRFGLFVTLDETGADGILPMGALGDDYFVHDEARHCLTGRRTGRTFRLGDALMVRLEEADPITGSLGFVLDDGTTQNRGTRRALR
ncbi:MAG: ribonuclease R [Alphaproteobacteria bacterium]|nr:ribonuclease R [Alphaproteobacteria bacterium]